MPVQNRLIQGCRQYFFKALVNTNLIFSELLNKAGIYRNIIVFTKFN